MSGSSHFRTHKAPTVLRPRCSRSSAVARPLDARSIEVVAVIGYSPGSVQVCGSDRVLASDATAVDELRDGVHGHPALEIRAPSCRDEHGYPLWSWTAVLHVTCRIHLLQASVSLRSSCSFEKALVKPGCTFLPTLADLLYLMLGHIMKNRYVLKLSLLFLHRICHCHIYGLHDPCGPCTMALCNHGPWYRSLSLDVGEATNMKNASRAEQSFLLLLIRPHTTVHTLEMTQASGHNMLACCKHVDWFSALEGGLIIQLDCISWHHVSTCIFGCMLTGSAWGHAAERWRYNRAQHRAQDSQCS